MIAQVRNRIGDWLQMRAIKRHGSRVGWQIAGRYSSYWEKARRRCPRPMPEDPVLRRAVEEFGKDRVTSFHVPETEALARSIAQRIDAREAAGETVWRPPLAGNSNVDYAGDLWRDFPEVKQILQGPLGAFLEGHFGCAYKIFFATMYQSTHVPTGPKSSALWHSDSGPGSCVNVMFCIDDTTPEDGAIEVLTWNDSISLFARERAEMRRRMAAAGAEETSKDARRDMLCNWYADEIGRDFADRIRQPVGKAGLVSVFANNTIHRGGFPQPGRRRRVVIFHAYPSDTPTDWAFYDANGIHKRGAYPADPSARF